VYVCIASAGRLHCKLSLHGPCCRVRREPLSVCHRGKESPHSRSKQSDRERKRESLPLSSSLNLPHGYSCVGLGELSFGSPERGAKRSSSSSRGAPIPVAERVSLPGRSLKRGRPRPPSLEAPAEHEREGAKERESEHERRRERVETVALCGKCSCALNSARANR